MVSMETDLAYVKLVKHYSKPYQFPHVNKYAKFSQSVSYSNKIL